MLARAGNREYYNAETGAGCGLDPFWGWSLIAHFLPYEDRGGADINDFQDRGLSDITKDYQDMTDTRLKGLYLLGAEPYDLIYGQPERDAIAELVDIYAPPQTPDSVARTRPSWPKRT